VVSGHEQRDDLHRDRNHDKDDSESRPTFPTSLGYYFYTCSLILPPSGAEGARNISGGADQFDFSFSLPEAF
jgi:hypothetical protein